MRKNEAKTDLDLFLYIQDNKNYVKPWEVKKTNNKFVQKILNKSSKSQTRNSGYPDLN